MAQREPGLVFGEVAETYDRVRPGYPRQLVLDLYEITGLRRGARVLEVGSGTGKATELLVRAGFEVVGLEPDAAMIEMARRRCPSVRFERTRFEDWAMSASSFELVAAAQTWHWVTPEVKWVKARAALVESGWLAIFWNRGAPPVENAIGPGSNEIEEVYARVASDCGDRRPPWAQEGGLDADLAASECFGPIQRRTYDWHRVYGRDEYLGLLRTESVHIVLDDDTRTRLFAEIGSLIDAHGGRINLDYTTELVVAPRA